MWKGVDSLYYLVIPGLYHLLRAEAASADMVEHSVPIWSQFVFPDIFPKAVMKHGLLPLSSSTASGRARSMSVNLTIATCRLLFSLLFWLRVNKRVKAEKRLVLRWYLARFLKIQSYWHTAIKWHMKVFTMVRCHFFAMLPAFTRSTAKVRTQTFDIGTFYTWVFQNR